MVPGLQEERCECSATVSDVMSILLLCISAGLPICRYHPGPDYEEVSTPAAGKASRVWLLQLPHYVRTEGCCPQQAPSASNLCACRQQLILDAICVWTAVGLQRVVRGEVEDCARRRHSRELRG